MTASGELGQLRVGYRWAANITGWRLNGGNLILGLPKASISAKVSEVDEFWCTQRPTKVALWMGQSWWVWSNPELDSELSVGANVSIVASGNPESLEDL